jgi:hypothetical protein
LNHSNSTTIGTLIPLYCRRITSITRKELRLAGHHSGKQLCNNAKSAAHQNEKPANNRFSYALES